MRNLEADGTKDRNLEDYGTKDRNLVIYKYQFKIKINIKTGKC